MFVEIIFPPISPYTKLYKNTKETILKIIFSLSKTMLIAMSLFIFTVSNLKAIESEQKSAQENAAPKQVYSNLCIIIPQSSSGAEYPAKFLQEILKKSLGRDIQIKKEDTSRKQAASDSEIHIGETEYVKSLKQDIANLDEDGFIIDFPSPHRITITARTDYGTKFGVYEFLEKFVGVRWLFPGNLGEYVPTYNELEIIPVKVRQEPVFKSRLLSFGPPPLSDDLSQWAERSRMRNRVNFHHSIWNFFHPSQYGKTHPEYYPVINGKRFIPETDSEDSWHTFQPCFTASGSPQAAADYIRKIRQQNPQETSFSFGVNDGFGFCECSQCRKFDNCGKNSEGFYNNSNTYYNWCNSVIKELGKPFQNISFGCLAYYNVATPPKNKLVSNLIPYITYDRMQLADPQRAQASKLLLDEWSAKASEIGWYDYIYGKQYCIPRVYFHLMADYLKYGASKNVRHYYAEAYPDENWQEGPKFYVTLKLLWNPELDVDKLLDEWYYCAVGPQAAASLKAYYAFWEDFWCRRALTSKWFTQNKVVTWLPFDNTEYLESLNEDDVKKCEILLREVKEKSVTPQQKQRAEHFFQNFLNIKKSITQIIKDNKLLANGAKLKTQISADDFSKNAIWDTWQREKSCGTFCYNARKGFSKAGCLEANFTGATGPMVFVKSFTVKPGKTYLVSVMVQTEGTEQNTAVNLILHWQDDKGAELENLPGKQVSIINPLKNWKKLEAIITAPAKTGSLAQLKVVLGCDKSLSGKVYFDDFSLSEIVPQ